MKKSIKFALVLILVGAIMVAGAILGGANVKKNFIGNLNMESEVKNEEFPAINMLNLDLKVYSVEILPSDDVDVIQVQYDETTSFGKLKYSLSFEVKNDELYIREISDRKVDININVPPFGNLFKGNKLILMVPEKITGNINQELGSFKAVNVTLEDLNYKTEMGSIDLIQVKAVNSKLETNMGSFDIKDSICENLNLETEMGSIDYSGTLLGTNDFSTKMGSLELELEQKRNDISLNLKTEMGEIKVDGEKGSIKEDKISKKAYLKAETEMGSIDIDFLK